MVDLDNYYWYKNVFTNEEIEEIHKIAKKEKEEDGGIFSGQEGHRKSTVKWLGYNDETAWIFKRIIDCMDEANKELWGFEWSGDTESIQYTIYESNVKGHYNWHMDLGGSNQDRKISAVVMLNDEYTGGGLEIWGKDLTEAYGKGNMVVFPSFLLHKVNPVIEGTRYSLVIWSGGESFK